MSPTLYGINFADSTTLEGFLSAIAEYDSYDGLRWWIDQVA